MPVKMTIAEYEDWAEDTFTFEADLYCEGEIVVVDGRELDPDQFESSSTVIKVLDDGWINANSNQEFKPINQVKHIRMWRKKRNSMTLSFSIDKSQAQALIDFAATLKAKQIK